MLKVDTEVSVGSVDATIKKSIKCCCGHYKYLVETHDGIPFYANEREIKPSHPDLFLVAERYLKKSCQFLRKLFQIQ